MFSKNISLFIYIHLPNATVQYLSYFFFKKILFGDKNMLSGSSYICLETLKLLWAAFSLISYFAQKQENLNSAKPQQKSVFSFNWTKTMWQSNNNNNRKPLHYLISPIFYKKKISSPILICFYFLFHIPANTKNFCERCLHRLQLSPDRFKCMLLFHGSLSIFSSDTADLFSEIWNR